MTIDGDALRLVKALKSERNIARAERETNAPADELDDAIKRIERWVVDHEPAHLEGVARFVVDHWRITSQMADALLKFVELASKRSAGTGGFKLERDVRR